MADTAHSPPHLLLDELCLRWVLCVSKLPGHVDDLLGQALRLLDLARQNECCHDNNLRSASFITRRQVYCPELG